MEPATAAEMSTYTKRNEARAFMTKLNKWFDLKASILTDGRKMTEATKRELDVLEEMMVKTMARVGGAAQ